MIVEVTTTVAIGFIVLVALLVFLLSLDWVWNHMFVQVSFAVLLFIIAFWIVGWLALQMVKEAAL